MSETSTKLYVHEFGFCTRSHRGKKRPSWKFVFLKSRQSYQQEVYSWTSADRSYREGGVIGLRVLFCLYDMRLGLYFRPLLTVETEVNGGLKEYKMEGSSSWLVRLACRAGTIYFCSALVALVSPVKKIFFSPFTISIPWSPSPSKLGRQQCCVACILVCVSDYTTVY